MDAFPLTPFFVALTAKGFHITFRDYERVSLALRARGPWTLKQLQAVLVALLVRDADQEEVLIRQFNQFFDPRLEPRNGLSEIDVNGALTDLDKLSQHNPEHVLSRLDALTPFSSDSQPDPDSSVPSNGRRVFTTRVILALGVGLFVIVGAVLYFKSSGTDSWNQGVEKAKTVFVWARNSKTLQIAIAILAISLTILLRRALAKRRKRNTLNRTKVGWNTSEPCHFDLSQIGGEPSAQLDSETVDYLADSLGYFQSYEPSKILDVRETIEATIENAGIPTLAYTPRKRLRAVIVVEDVLAESLTWNRASRELADGLSQRGVPMLYGGISGSPPMFRTSEGTICLDDLEDDRRGYLLLIFSDRRSFREAFVLEALARWPMIAWMELREPLFWDDATTIALQLGIPVYPANDYGIRLMTDRFLKEEGQRTDFRVPDISDGLISLTEDNFDVYLEALLGDALPWAQACATFQPLSIGLADALRRKFHGDLPPDRIQRIFAISGTNYSAAGLRFGHLALEILRSGFRIRRSIDKQIQVLRFIIEEIEKVEPAERNSLAHLAWEWTLERARFSLEPEGAMVRLEQLTRSPLAAAILEERETEPFVLVSEEYWSGDMMYEAVFYHIARGDYHTAREILGDDGNTKEWRGLVIGGRSEPDEL